MILRREDIVDEWIDLNPGKLPSRRAVKLEGGWDQSLCLGKEIYLSSEERVVSLSGDESVNIKPGEFALMLTEEWLRMPPDRMAFISLRLEYKLRGLINVSGFHVDPTYTGHLLFAVYNAGPNLVSVRRWDRLFKIIFVTMTGKITKKLAEPITRIDSKHFASLGGPAVSLPALKQQFERMERRLKSTQAWLITTVITFVATVVGGVIVAVLTNKPA